MEQTGVREATTGLEHLARVSSTSGLSAKSQACCSPLPSALVSGPNLGRRPCGALRSCPREERVPRTPGLPPAHEQTSRGLFRAVDLSSSPTGSCLLLIKANVLKFVKDFLFLFFFNRSGFKVISVIKSLTPVQSGAFSSGTGDEARGAQGRGAGPRRGAAHGSPRPELTGGVCVRSLETRGRLTIRAYTLRPCCPLGSSPGPALTLSRRSALRAEGVRADEPLD